MNAETIDLRAVQPYIALCSHIADIALYSFICILCYSLIVQPI